MIIPSDFELKESKIPNAGKGIFTKVRISTNTLIGEYKGRWIPINDKGPLMNLSYSWEIDDYRGNKDRPKGMKLSDHAPIGYIDASDPKDSNFLRYLNHPSYKDLDNVTPYQVKDKIYYVTTREILPGEELYVNYGSEYGEILKLVSDIGK